MTRRAPKDPAELAARRAIRARDAGLRRIAAITRGLVAATVALCGGLAIVAANAFHGSTISASRAQVLAAAPASSRAATRVHGRRRGSTRATLELHDRRSRRPDSTTRGRSHTTGGTSASQARSPAAQTAPASTPTQTTPAQSTPTQTTPAQSTPTQTTPAQSTPTQTTPAQSTPTQNASAQSTPASSSAGLTQPTQTPAPTPAAPVVVSGGS